MRKKRKKTDKKIEKRTKKMKEKKNGNRKNSIQWVVTVFYKIHRLTNESILSFVSFFKHSNDSTIGQGPNLYDHLHYANQLFTTQTQHLQHIY